MSFDSWIYALFLPAVLAVYWFTGRRFQNTFLLGASWLFYGWWDWRFLGLLILTTGLDYAVGLLLARPREPSARRRILLVSIAANLGVLAIFKYLGFFADSAARILALAGLHADPVTLDIVLPVGISFYTFQSMSYTIDVYRGHLPACRDPVAFALYVAFFPQLVAGPIERATNLLPQIGSDRVVTGKSLRDGSFLILLGLFKKTALADAMVPLVDAAFQAPGDAAAAACLRAAYLFTFQIYLDFSGYSDIARGSAKLMGFELMENFRQPFLADRFSDLWRRWHVSLSTWLRDYLYIPLGGSRGGRARVAINLLATMTLSGLWHGAAWTFVLWGFLHGLLLAGERILFGSAPPAPAGAPTAGARLLRGLRIVLVFHVLVMLFVVFRARDIDVALAVFRGIARFPEAAGSWTLLWPVAFYGAIVLALDLVQERAGHHAAIADWPAPARGVVYATMILFVISWSRGLDQPFIYFQF